MIPFIFGQRVPWEILVLEQDSLNIAFKAKDRLRSSNFQNEVKELPGARLNLYSSGIWDYWRSSDGHFSSPIVPFNPVVVGSGLYAAFLPLFRVLFTPMIPFSTSFQNGAPNETRIPMHNNPAMSLKGSFLRSSG